MEIYKNTEEKFMYVVQKVEFKILFNKFLLGIENFY